MRPTTIKPLAGILTATTLMTPAMATITQTALASEMPVAATQAVADFTSGEKTALSRLNFRDAQDNPLKSWDTTPGEYAYYGLPAATGENVVKFSTNAYNGVLNLARNDDYSNGVKNPHGSYVSDVNVRSFKGLTSGQTVTYLFTSLSKTEFQKKYPNLKIGDSSTTPSGTSKKGDVNGDGKYDVKDLTGLKASVDGVTVTGFRPDQAGPYDVPSGKTVSLNGVPDGWSSKKESNSASMIFRIYDPDGKETIDYTFRYKTSDTLIGDVNGDYQYNMADLKGLKLNVSDNFDPSYIKVQLTAEELGKETPRLLNVPEGWKAADPKKVENGYDLTVTSPDGKFYCTYQLRDKDKKLQPAANVPQVLLDKLNSTVKINGEPVKLTSSNVKITDSSGSASTVYYQAEYTEPLKANSRIEASERTYIYYGKKGVTISVYDFDTSSDLTLLLKFDRKNAAADFSEQAKEEYAKYGLKDKDGKTLVAPGSIAKGGLTVFYAAMEKGSEEELDAQFKGDNANSSADGTVRTYAFHDWYTGQDAVYIVTTTPKDQLTEAGRREIEHQIEKYNTNFGTDYTIDAVDGSNGKTDTPASNPNTGDVKNNADAEAKTADGKNATLALTGTTVNTTILAVAAAAAIAGTVMGYAAIGRTREEF